MMKTNISAGHPAPAYIWQSPIGPLGIVTSERGVVRIQFTHEQDGVVTDVQDEFTRACIQQLDEYFAGQRREFTVPLDMRGTPFQLACWNGLLRIPYGETRSYAEQAVAVG